MNLLYLIISSVTVSIDGFSAGAVIGARGTAKRFKCVLCVGVIVIIMCFAACLLGERLNSVCREISVYISGCILVFIGAKELFDREKHNFFVRKRGLMINTGEIISLGVGVGADGACASLSLNLSGYGFYPVATVGAFHVAFVYLGAAFGERLRSYVILKKLPSVILIFLGAAKLLVA